jgi:THO complex subunit 5
VPLYSVDEFKRLAPEEARTEQVLSDDHQLMLNRLSFELAERQRLDFPYMLICSEPNIHLAWI